MELDLTTGRQRGPDARAMVGLGDDPRRAVRGLRASADGPRGRARHRERQAGVHGRRSSAAAAGWRRASDQRRRQTADPRRSADAAHRRRLRPDHRAAARRAARASAASSSRATATRSSRSGATPCCDAGTATTGGCRSSPGGRRRPAVGVHRRARARRGRGALHSVTLVDPTIRGELGHRPASAGPSSPRGSLVVRGDTIAVNSRDCGESITGPTTLASAKTLEVVASVPDSEGQVLGVSPDGRMVVRQEHRRALGLAARPVGRGDRRAPARSRRMSLGHRPLGPQPALPDRPRLPRVSRSHRSRCSSRHVAWTPDSRLVALVDGFDAVRRPSGTLRPVASSMPSTGLGPHPVDGLQPGWQAADRQSATTAGWRPSIPPPGRRSPAASSRTERLSAGRASSRTGGRSWRSPVLAAAAGVRCSASTARRSRSSGSTRAHDGSPKAIAVSPDAARRHGCGRRGRPGLGWRDGRAPPRGPGRRVRPGRGVPRRRADRRRAARRETSWSSRSTARTAGDRASLADPRVHPRGVPAVRVRPCPTLEELRGD